MSTLSRVPDCQGHSLPVRHQCCWRVALQPTRQKGAMGERLPNIHPIYTWSKRDGRVFSGRLSEFTTAIPSLYQVNPYLLLRAITRARGWRLKLLTCPKEQCVTRCRVRANFKHRLKVKTEVREESEWVQGVTRQALQWPAANTPMLQGEEDFLRYQRWGILSYST